MNIKRLIVACIAVFVWVFASNYVLHGIILQNTYAQTASLWRPESEMGKYFVWLLGGQLLQSVMFCIIYAMRGGTRTGVGQGIGYGLLIALLMQAGESLITYAVQPMPMNVMCSWFVGGLIQFAIAGAILGAIYKPAAPTTAPVA